MKPHLGIALTGLLALHVSTATAADKWTRVQSKNFTLVGNATENQIREVAEGLEVFRTAFSRFFKLKEGSSVATTVIVFRSDDAFKPFKPLYNGKPANLAGFFQSGQDMNFIALAADIEAPRVIYHELVHKLMSDNMGTLPPWFQEGFAECFSSFEIEGKDKKVLLGRAIAEHVQLLNQRRFMPLEQLFSVTHDSPEYNEEEKQGVFYAESWALVHYMMFATEQRRKQFQTFLAEIENGRPAPEAFEKIFNTELSAFQKVFEAYIYGRQAWGAFEMKTPEGLNRSKDMTSKVISEAEAEAHLGDLLLRLDRLPEAEAHLTKAVKLDPKLGGAQTAMGRLHMEKGSKAEAQTYLKRATELDPDNYLTHYYYASLIRSQKEATSEDRDNLRRELQRAIELNPQFVEATELLAAENLQRNIDIPQTIELLAKAIAVAPGRDYLVLQLANAMSRTQQREVARPILRSLLSKPGLDPPLRQNAESLMAFLDRATAVDSANRAIAERNRAIEEQLARNTAPSVSDVPSVVDNPASLRRTAPAPASTEPEAPTPPIVRRNDSLPPGTARILGTLTLLDCRNGLTLSLVVEGKTVKLHSATPNEIRFTSFNPGVRQQISCGPVPGNGLQAAIVYRPKESEGSIGDPLTVDFIETLSGTSQPLPSIPGTSTVQGLLITVDCSNGVSVALLSEGKMLRFHADRSSKVAFLNGPNSDGTVTCGPMPGSGLPVTIVYRPSSDADIAGEPLIVQFQRN